MPESSMAEAALPAPAIQRENSFLRYPFTPLIPIAAELKTPRRMASS